MRELSYKNSLVHIKRRKNYLTEDCDRAFYALSHGMLKIFFGNKMKAL